MSELNDSEMIVYNQETLVDITKLKDSNDNIISITFVHKINYRIAPEIYTQWPKFYSVVLDGANKQIVSLEFRNNPDFSAINKALTFFGVEPEYRNVSQSQQIMLRIPSKGEKVTAYLSNIYYNFSIEAAETLYSALYYIAEDILDKETPTWKQDIGIYLSSFSNSEESQDLNTKKNSCNKFFNLFGQCKEQDQPEYFKYKSMNKEEKDTIFKGLISNDINKKAKELLKEGEPEYIKEMSYYEKYKNVEHIFNTTDKCNNYLYLKSSELQPLVEEMQLSINTTLTKLFEPSTFDKISNALGDTLFSDKWIKLSKTLTSGAGATVGLSLKYIFKCTTESSAIAGAAVPVIFEALDFIKIFIAGAVVTKEVGKSNLSKEIFPKKEINIDELSKSFSCKITICNINNFMNLNHESQKTVAEFYSKFIHSSITQHPHPYPTEFYLASNLLDRLSNQSYVDRLDLQKELITPLETDDGTIFSIKEYIQNYNQTSCYENILHDMI